jgi:hypothetical protein
MDGVSDKSGYYRTLKWKIIKAAKRVTPTMLLKANKFDCLEYWFHRQIKVKTIESHF